MHMSNKLGPIVFVLWFFLSSWTWAEKQGNAPKDGCTKDTDCKGSRLCEDGKCVEPATTPAKDTEEGCSKDTDCKGSRICESSKCVESSAKPSAVEKKVKGSASVGKGKIVGGKGTLESAEVNKVIKSKLTAIKVCYEKALQKNPTLEGKLSLRFTIGTDGRVTSALIAYETLADPEVSSCVITKIKYFVFSKPEGGSVEYLFPFVFKPAEAGKQTTTTGMVKSSASAGKGIKVGGKGTIASADVNKVIKSRLTAFKMCYEKALKDNPSLKGKISLRFTIGTSGNVTSSSIEYDGIKDSGLSTCLIEKVKTFVFSKPEGGVVIFVFPLVFSHSG
jgi:outer membrane biosynthesis protein TonB